MPPDDACSNALIRDIIFYQASREGDAISICMETSRRKRANYKQPISGLKV